MANTPINYGDGIVSDHRARIIDDNGEFTPNSAAHTLDTNYRKGLHTPILSMNCTGGKDGKLYSLYPTDGTADFTVTRSTILTRINNRGISEDVPVNTAVIDYSTGKPVLKVTTETIQTTLPAEIASITLTDKDGVETINSSPASPYVIPVGEWLSITNTL